MMCGAIYCNPVVSPNVNECIKVIKPRTSDVCPVSFTQLFRLLIHVHRCIWLTVFCDVCIKAFSSVVNYAADQCWTCHIVFEQHTTIPLFSKTAQMSRVS